MKLCVSVLSVLLLGAAILDPPAGDPKPGGVVIIEAGAPRDSNPDGAKDCFEFVLLSDTGRKIDVAKSVPIPRGCTSREKARRIKAAIESDPVLGEMMDVSQSGHVLTIEAEGSMLGMLGVGCHNGSRQCGMKRRVTWPPAPDLENLGVAVPRLTEPPQTIARIIMFGSTDAPGIVELGVDDTVVTLDVGGYAMVQDIVHALVDRLRRSGVRATEVNQQTIEIDLPADATLTAGCGSESIEHYVWVGAR